jgi:hypothetical protein
MDAIRTAKVRICTAKLLFIEEAGLRLAIEQGGDGGCGRVFFLGVIL